MASLHPWAYPILLNQMGPLLSTSINHVFHSYIVNKKPLQMNHSDVDDERELELLQMDRFIKWMRLVFDEAIPSSEPLSPRSETRREYKKELYTIYITICTDYKEYQKWKKYNQSIWILSSYRSKDTHTLSKKILSDVKLFKEGLQLYSMLDNLSTA